MKVGWFWNWFSSIDFYICLKIFLLLPQYFAGRAMDQKSIFLMVRSVTYGLIASPSIFHPDGMDQLKIKILIQNFMSEGDDELEGGAFSLHLSFPRRCPGSALALIDNVFLQQYNPPFCFHFYSCKFCWWLEGLSACYCKKGSCSISWISSSFDTDFLFFSLP